jgi:hypothetical protein
MSIGVTKINIEQSARHPGHSEWTITFITTAQPKAQTLRKRGELQIVGLIMFLAAYNPDLAQLIASRQEIDPEKVDAVLGLIGCTAEDLAQEDEDLRKAEAPEIEMDSGLKVNLGLL